MPGLYPTAYRATFPAFYAVGSSLFLLSVCFCLCSLFYRDDVLCWLLLARPFLYAFHAHLRFPVDLVWFRLSCDHGWIRSGSVNVRKQQQQQQLSVGEAGRKVYFDSLSYPFSLYISNYVNVKGRALGLHRRNRDGLETMHPRVAGAVWSEQYRHIRRQHFPLPTPNRH